MRAPVLLACLVLYGIVPCVARADEPGISLTIYGDNLALVQDHRTILRSSNRISTSTS
jgi:hypothetical protein